MDLASLLGIGLCITLVVFAIVSGDQGFSALNNFIDAPSALITIGGALCATLAQNSIGSFIGGLKTITLVFKMPALDSAGIIKKIIELSNVARKEGLLALEEAAADLDDAFLKKGVLLIVDGTDPDLVRGILETEMVSIDVRHKGNMGLWDTIAAMGPAWGMIGTLVGLVNMLQALDDPSAIGPSMAVALITTLYGSMMANWICAPVSGKLKMNNDAEMQVKEIMIEGLLSIQAGENPRVIEEKLKSFLSPSDREGIGEGSEGGDS